MEPMQPTQPEGAPPADARYPGPGLRPCVAPRPGLGPGHGPCAVPRPGPRQLCQVRTYPREQQKPMQLDTAQPMKLLQLKQLEPTQPKQLIDAADAADATVASGEESAASLGSATPGTSFRQILGPPQRLGSIFEESSSHHIWDQFLDNLGATPPGISF